MLRIGNLELNSNLILAPMAGVSDLPFRLLNRRFGCEFAFVEMINVRSLGYNSRKTKGMLTTNNMDRPLGVQILGCEDNFILRGLDILKNYKFDILDFNAACPVKKVVRRGEGAGLLNEPQRLHHLLKLVVRNSTVPVTLKIRLGWDKNSINASDVALLAEDAGISCLFVHGRTKTQGYSGTIDYNSIREVKRRIKIPLIASGNILCAQLAKKMLDETGCDGLLIARGALGNPWIFKEISEFLENGREILKPELNETADIMIEHLNMCVDFYTEKNGVVIFRKFYSWYTRGLQKIRPLRERSSRARTKVDMIAIIEQIRNCRQVKRVLLPL